MVRRTTTRSVLLLTVTLAVAGPALADEGPEAEERIPCVTITLNPPDAHVDVECVKDLLPPPPPEGGVQPDTAI